MGPHVETEQRADDTSKPKDLEQAPVAARPCDEAIGKSFPEFGTGGVPETRAETEAAGHGSEKQTDGLRFYPPGAVVSAKDLRSPSIMCWMLGVCVSASWFNAAMGGGAPRPQAALLVGCQMFFTQMPGLWMFAEVHGGLPIWVPLVFLTIVMATSMAEVLNKGAYTGMGGVLSYMCFFALLALRPGPRRALSLASFFLITILQPSAVAVPRFIEEMQACTSPLVGAVIFPLYASAYQTVGNFVYSLLWWKLNRGGPASIYVIVINSVRFTAEGIYVSGLLSTILGRDPAEAFGAAMLSVVMHVAATLPTRLGAFDAFIYFALRQANTDSADQDLLLRCNSQQIFVMVPTAIYVACLSAGIRIFKFTHAEAYITSTIWFVFGASCVAYLVAMMIVAARSSRVLANQRGKDDEPLSFMQIFMRMHEPQMHPPMLVFGQLKVEEKDLPEQIREQRSAPVEDASQSLRDLYCFPARFLQVVSCLCAAIYGVHGGVQKFWVEDAFGSC